MVGTRDAKDDFFLRRFAIVRPARIAAAGLAFVLCLVLGILSATIAADDSYIAGYAAAVLEHEFNVPGAIVQVRNGVVIVTADSLGKVDRDKVLTALGKIPGVVRAEVREDAGPPPVPADSPQPVIQQELPKGPSPNSFLAISSWLLSMPIRDGHIFP